MKASQVQPGDVLSTSKGTWMIREVKPMADDRFVGVKISAGRTDHGIWFKINRNSELEIYRPKVTDL